MKYWVIYLTLFYVSCAVMAPPSGGPPDETPPGIIEVYPNKDTTNIELDTDIFFTFSERVDKNALKYSTFISPAPDEEFTYDWDGNKCCIRLEKTLQDSQTYVITIGSGVADLRSNKMKESYSWAFSTGDKIDNCSISGAVRGTEELSEILIKGFRLQDYDTLNPAIIKGGYVTKTDENGNYNLNNLAKGKYRVFGISDKNGNLIYDIRYDEIGIPQSDVVLWKDSAYVQNVSFMMTLEDTSDFRLLAAQPTDQYHIDLQFSKNIDKTSLKENFTVNVKDKDEKKLNVFSYYIDEEFKTKLRLITEKQDSTDYFCTVENLKDDFGYRLSDTYDTTSFTGSTIVDTTKPYVKSYFPPDSSENIEIRKDIKIIFSEDIDTTNVSSKMEFRVGEGEIIAPLIQWYNLSELRIKPAEGFKSEESYSFSLKVNQIKDFAGNTLKDSSFSIFFKKDTESNTGSISGKLVDNSRTFGKYIIIIEDVSRKEIKYRIELNEPKNWLIDKIPPGEYNVYVFKDINNDGEYTYGKSYPFRPSEKFYYYPDVVEVRKGWESEDIDLYIY